MPRHELTKQEQINGLRKALDNPKTPKQFLPAMRVRLENLLRQLPKGSRR
jgi:hypothetical protein